MTIAEIEGVRVVYSEPHGWYGTRSMNEYFRKDGTWSNTMSLSSSPAWISGYFETEEEVIAALKIDLEKSLKDNYPTDAYIHWADENLNETKLALRAAWNNLEDKWSLQLLLDAAYEAGRMSLIQLEESLTKNQRRAKDSAKLWGHTE